MSEPVISLDGISKHYGNFTAVQNLSFAVKPGEIYGFLGPNGAGKTTTLRTMLDIIQPSTGTLKILGSDTALPVRHRIGYLPEERGLYRKMTAQKSISYFAQLRGVERKRANQIASELLTQYGLEDFAQAKSEALSKGMAQKVQLLSTIAHDPDLLILDEPFSGLDPINQQTLENLIRDQQSRGKTIIFSTHVMQHAERLCDRFLILARGNKVFEGTLREAQQKFAQRVHLRAKIDVGALSTMPDVVSAVLKTAPESGEHGHLMWFCRIIIHHRTF